MPWVDGQIEDDESNVVVTVVGDSCGPSMIDSQWKWILSKWSFVVNK